MPADEPFEPLRVLVADDDATSRTLLASHVRRLGHSIATASTGIEAWEAFQRLRPSLVIADWMMPGLDGLALCRRIRERVGDECFVMLVTSKDGHEDLDLALQAGADDYLGKPVAAKQFRARVVIARRRLELAKARRAAEQEVTRMRWLAGIGQTVLLLQHEINNPLTALFGCLESVGVDASLSEADQRCVECALEQVDRIADVVRRLSTLDHASTVERIPGIPMLDLPHAIAAVGHGVEAELA